MNGDNNGTRPTHLSSEMGLEHFPPADRFCRRTVQRGPASPRSTHAARRAEPGRTSQARQTKSPAVGLGVQNTGNASPRKPAVPDRPG